MRPSILFEEALELMWHNVGRKQIRELYARTEKGSFIRWEFYGEFKSLHIAVHREESGTGEALHCTRLRRDIKDPYELDDFKREIYYFIKDEHKANIPNEWFLEVALP